MHGFIFREFKKFVEKRFSPELWEGLLAKVNLTERIYLPIQTYPDKEFEALIKVLGENVGKSRSEILEEFGFFIARAFFDMYGMLIKPNWRTLDLIERTEEVIHRLVRLQNPGAKPPFLKVRRLNPKIVEINYNSPRKMCHFAKGIVRAISHYYGENIKISDEKCMLKGDSKCLIKVELL